MRLYTIVVAACILLGTSGCAAVGSYGDWSLGGHFPAPGGRSDSPPADERAERPASSSVLDQAILAELNLARTDPDQYAEILKAWLPQFRGKEGTKAIREAIHELEATRPLEALSSSPGLSAAAYDHVRDQGRTGEVGHTGSDGSDPFTRIRRYVSTNGAAENIAYGHRTARDIVASLLIDDGIPGRGHRKNILNPNYQLAGVATGHHARYGIMCVMDFSYPGGPATDTR